MNKSQHAEIVKKILHQGRRSTCSSQWFQHRHQANIVLVVLLSSTRLLRINALDWQPCWMTLVSSAEIHYPPPNCAPDQCKCSLSISQCQYFFCIFYNRPSYQTPSWWTTARLLSVTKQKYTGLFVRSFNSYCHSTYNFWRWGKTRKNERYYFQSDPLTSTVDRIGRWSRVFTTSENIQPMGRGEKPSILYIFSMQWFYCALCIHCSFRGKYYFRSVLLIN